MSTTSKAKESTAFNLLDTPEKMIKFLRSGSRLKDCSSLHHYTSVKNLISMLQSGYLYLGNPKNMNDRHELKCGNTEIWERTYFTSFMLENSESIGMWSMYAQPWTEGVRLSIPKEICKNWLKQIKCLYLVDENNKCTEESIEIKSDCERFQLEAVVYTGLDEDGKNCYYCGKQTNELEKISKEEKSLTGFVKDNAWSYEKEIRLKATLTKSVNYDKLAIKMTDEVIDNLIITPSPLFEGDFLDKLDKNIRSKVCKDNLSDSLFKGKLENVDPCQKCEKIKSP